MKRLLASTAFVLFAFTAAQARVDRIEISKREPLASGQTFGDAGAYERIVGRFHGELDPSLPLNAVIVDLDKAPRNTRNMVEYTSDFYIIRPVDLSKGSGALLYDVNNRGNMNALRQFNSAPRSNDPATLEEAGNGFLMRNGYSVVWSGWIPGLPARDNAIRIDVPTARMASGPIEQMVWDEFLFNNDKTTQGRLTFRAVSTDKTKATLYMRHHNSEQPTAVAPEQWEFVDARTVRLLPAGTPFPIGVIYQLVYRAADPPVSGIGFAATRDLIAFLRHAGTDDYNTPNPLAANGQPAIKRALAHGTSQSGRYLRDFVYSGFNEDEANRIVFDGVNPHVATARTSLNYRFGQPNRIIQTAFGFLYYPGASFPFNYEAETDPFSGARDSILQRCTARGNCPKIIHTTSSAEYWQTGESLVTTDPTSQRDVTLPDNVRIYLFSGTQHISSNTMPKGVCAMPPARVDYRPLLRAVLVNLDRWVKDGTAPPASRYPRLDDGSLVPMITLPAPVPGFILSHGPNPRIRLDYGPDYAKGIVDKVLPVTLKDSYKTLVPNVDADGNETSGLRLPDITVPTGTATGWNMRAKGAGGDGEMCYLDGAFVPFAKTKAEREAAHDPRPSLAERYPDGADYTARVQKAASALAHDGYLLDEDVKRLVDKAAATTW